MEITFIIIIILQPDFYHTNLNKAIQVIQERLNTHINPLSYFNASFIVPLITHNSSSPYHLTHLNYTKIKIFAKKGRLIARSISISGDLNDLLRHDLMQLPPNAN